MKIAGHEIPIPVLLVVFGAAALYWLLRSKRRAAPNADQRQQVAGGAAQRAGGAARAANLSPQSLEDQLRSGAYSDWNVVISTDAFIAKNGGNSVDSAATGPTSSFVLTMPNADASSDILQKFNLRKLVLVHRIINEKRLKEEKEAVTAWAKQHLSNAGFNRHQLIFCTTEKGIEATARQFQPTLFISGISELGNFLAAFLPYVVTIESPNSTPKLAPSSTKPKAKAIVYSSLAALPI